MEIEIRKTILSDIGPLVSIVSNTGFFRPCEIDVAYEVLSDSVLSDSNGYFSYTAVAEGKILGWVCFGETPCTEKTFDIYWIAVDSECQKQGVGSKLIDFAESEIRDYGGRLAVIETSGSEKYDSTFSFYLKVGYVQAAAIEDFYAEGDPKIIFVKKLK